MSDSPDPLARFAAALTRLRESGGWTRYQLARDAGTNETALHAMERGERSPRLEMLCRLADVLGCSLDELCGREAT